MKKKVLILLILFFLLGIPKFKTSAVTKSEIEAMPHEEHFSLLVKNIESTYEYYLKTKNLNIEGKEVYRLLVKHFSDNINNYNQPIEWQVTPANNLEDEEMKNVLKAFLGDYKVFFWLTGYVNYGITTSASLVTYTFNFEILDIYNNFEVFKQDLLEVVVNREHIKDEVDLAKNTYSKIKVIHDWLVTNNTYNKTGEESHTPVGALVDRFGPVCEAYAEAFLMIANYVNIKSIYATGIGTSGGNSEAHAWNYVYIVDQWYFLDVTWAKPLGAPTHNYNYFLTAIPSSHVQDSEEVKPTPFTTSKYLASQVAEFEVVSQYYYERTGSPIKGFDTIRVSNSIITQVDIKYYDIEGNLLSQIPRELGKYYFIATPKQPTTLNGDIVVFYEIVPLMHTVNFYDESTTELIKSEKVYDGNDATIPLSTVEGYKYTTTGNYKNVNNDIDIYIKLAPVVITFYGQNNQPLEINLFKNNSSEIINYNFDFINPDADKIFVGWRHEDKLITSETFVVSDLNLHPVIENIEIEIADARVRDGIYYINPKLYNKEEITLSSNNQVIINKVASTVNDDKTYTITLKIGSQSSTQERIVEITLKQSTSFFNLELDQIILYGGAALIGIVIISISVSVIKSRREN